MLYLHTKSVSYPFRVGEDVFMSIPPLEISRDRGCLCWLVIMRDKAGT